MLEKFFDRTGEIFYTCQYFQWNEIGFRSSTQNSCGADVYFFTLLTLVVPYTCKTFQRSQTFLDRSTRNFDGADGSFPACVRCFLVFVARAGSYLVSVARVLFFDSGVVCDQQYCLLLRLFEISTSYTRWMSEEKMLTQESSTFVKCQILFQTHNSTTWRILPLNIVRCSSLTL